MSTYAISTLQLPWSLTNEDELFNKIMRVCFILFVVVALPLTLIHLPEPSRAEKEQLPPQLARIMLEKQELPKPEEKKPEEKKPEEKKPDEKKPEEKKPDEKKPVDKSDKNDKPIKDDQKALDKAREKAASKMNQLKDDLMDMRESLNNDKVANASTENLINNAQATQVERSGVFNTVNRGSGGIAQGGYSRDTGGVALSGHETKKVTSGLGDSLKKASAERGGAGGAGGGEGKGRSTEEIRKVIDENSGPIFNLYHKALRENPDLKGVMILTLVIEPSGKISDVKIESSELHDPDLEAKIVLRLKLISFPASSAAQTVSRYSLVFDPNN